MRRKLFEELDGREIKRVSIFQEGVGGTPEERKKIEAHMESMVNDVSGPRWLVTRWSNLVAAKFYSFMRNEEKAEELRFFVDSVQMFRDLKALSGAPLRFRLIDMDETHPGFDSVRTAFFPSSNVVDAFLSLPPSEGSKVHSNPKVLLLAAAFCYQEQIRSIGEAVKVRDELVMTQLASHLADPEPGALNVVMVGSGHARIARGSSRVVSAMPPHLEEKVPGRFDNSLCTDMESMKVRKVACAQPLDVRDGKELMLYRLLYPLVADRLFAEPGSLNGRGPSEIVNLASFMATQYLILNRKSVDQLFDACAESLRSNPAAPNMEEALCKPLAEHAAKIVANPRKAIGFDCR